MDKMKELDRAIASEKDPKTLERLRAVRAIRKFDHSVLEMARHYDVTDKTIRNWLRRFDKDGPAGMKNLPKSGRPPAVKMTKIKRIAKRLFEKGDLTTATLRDAIHRETGAKFHESYVRRTLRRLDFTSKLPDTVHAEAASDEECDRWYRTTMKRIRRWRRRGFAICIQDEAIISMFGKARRRRWTPRGTKLRMYYTGRRDKKILYGVQFDDGSQIFRFKDKFNSDSFIQFLAEVIRKKGKVFMILDGAPQHFSKKAREFLRKHKRKIILCALPAASPHMSWMEKIWSISKGATEATRSYSSLEEKIAHMSEYLRTTRFSVSIYPYLMRRLGSGNYI